MMKTLIPAILLVALSGCTSSEVNTAAVVRKYSAPPEQGHWELIGDTQEFWQDVEVLYRASLRGNPNAMRTILVIGTFTDGAISEGMPDLSEVVKKHPEVAKQVILGDTRLKHKYSHWVP